MKVIEILHITRFEYSAPIQETVMELRLKPIDGDGQRCVSFDIEVTPTTRLATYRDGYGNSVHYFNILKSIRGLQVTSRAVVERFAIRGDPPDPDPIQDFLRFREPVTDPPGVRALAARHRVDDLTSTEKVTSALEQLTKTISREFAYDRTVTNVYSTVDQVLELKAGVCQDFAHLLVAVARAMGVPARYVSGYIHAPGEGSASGASHAWAEAWVPGRGWVGFDATHPVEASLDHVRIAVGRDYRDAAPTRGVYVGSAVGPMRVRVRTRELPATPAR